MLKTKTSWNGEINEVLVVDTDGGVWTPSESAQEEIQAAEDKAAKAIEICQSAPMRGTWAQ